MRKILFVTDRNIVNTSGELRLIKNRAESLFAHFGISTDFIVFQHSRRINGKHEQINAGGEIKYFCFNTKRPFLSYVNYKKMIKYLLQTIRSNSYDAVVLSGPFMPKLSKKIRKISDIKIICDIHGALEDCLELSNDGTSFKKLFYKMIYNLDSKQLMKYNYLFDGFFVVTDALKDYLINNYHVSNDKRFYIVPCATNASLMSENEFYENRRVFRNKYGISDDEILFVYSGGTTCWQCVDETIKLYKNIANQLKKKSKFLLLTYEASSVLKQINNDDRFIIDNYPANELFRALCACDVAFLLRKDSLTNNVAFPNKFLEYVISGLHIIATPYVFELAKQIKETEIGYIYDFVNDTDLIEHLNSIDIYNKMWNQRERLLQHNEFVNTLKCFVSDLQGEE